MIEVLLTKGIYLMKMSKVLGASAVAGVVAVAGCAPASAAIITEERTGTAADAMKN